MLREQPCRTLNFSKRDGTVAIERLSKALQAFNILFCLTYQYSLPCMTLIIYTILPCFLQLSGSLFISHPAAPSMVRNCLHPARNWTHGQPTNVSCRPSDMCFLSGMSEQYDTTVENARIMRCIHIKPFPWQLKKPSKIDCTPLGTVFISSSFSFDLVLSAIEPSTATSLDDLEIIPPSSLEFNLLNSSAPLSPWSYSLRRKQMKWWSL